MASDLSQREWVGTSCGSQGILSVPHHFVSLNSAKDYLVIRGRRTQSLGDLRPGLAAKTQPSLKIRKLGPHKGLGWIDSELVFRQLHCMLVRLAGVRQILHPPVGVSQIEPSDRGGRCFVWGTT